MLVMMSMHTGQLTVPSQTARRLVREQFPQWACLPLRRVSSHGTVNALFRLGDRLAIRFPLQSGDVDIARQQLEAEARAAHELRGHTRFPTPEPVALGEPGPGYPLPWSVQTWLPGTVATDDNPSASVEFAHDLAGFVHDVRMINTGGRTFTGAGRGGDLRGHDTWVQTCFERSEQLLDVAFLRRLWTTLRELPRRTPDVMTHGDLIPGNMLISGGRLVGIIDVGGLGPADPALDLVCAWHVLEACPRLAFRAGLGCDDLEWERGKAWAFEQAIGLVWYYSESNPTVSQLGRRTLERILAAPASKDIQ